MASILITSGGTKVPIDEVRHIGNMSSGRFGADLAKEALFAGHKVLFLCAKGSVRPDQIVLDLKQDFLAEGVKALADNMALAELAKNRLTVIEYRDFDDYLAKLEDILQPTTPQRLGVTFDVIMLAAAVSDYGMPPTGGKISSDKDDITFTLTKLPKVITRVRELAPKSVMVGFKLLVDVTPEVMDAAVAKQIENSGSDFVVANDLRSIKQGGHTVYIYKKDDADPFNPVVSDYLPAKAVISYVTGAWKNPAPLVRRRLHPAAVKESP